MSVIGDVIGDGLWNIGYGELMIRLLIATVLGGAIGIEREWNNHAAGFRTHILVCLGSTTIMLLSIHGFADFVNELNVRVDPARLAAQVVSGIGFLGAGAIMRNGNIIKGLTTAASIWVVAAIGLCVGAGFLIGAFVCTFFVLISLYLLNKWEKHLLRHRRSCVIDLVIVDEPGALGDISLKFEDKGIQIENMKMTSTVNQTYENEGKKLLNLRFSLKIQKKDKWLTVMEEIKSLETVISLAMENAAQLDLGQTISHKESV